MLPASVRDAMPEARLSSLPDGSEQDDLPGLALVNCALDAATRRLEVIVQMRLQRVIADVQNLARAALVAAAAVEHQPRVPAAPAPQRLVVPGLGRGELFVGRLISSGKSSGVIVGPGASARARSMTRANCRTFPGQAYAASASIAEGSTGRCRVRRCRLRKVLDEQWHVLSSGPQRGHRRLRRRRCGNTGPRGTFPPRPAPAGFDSSRPRRACSLGGPTCRRPVPPKSPGALGAAWPAPPATGPRPRPETACRGRPARTSRAGLATPVAARSSMPNSSASRRLSTSAAQLTGTNGPPRHGLV